MVEQVQGIVAVIGAIVFFGSFALPLNVKSVKKEAMDPVVMQIYASATIALTGFLVLMLVEWEFIWWGMLGACFWVPTSICTIIAMQFIELSIAQGVWSGVTVLISILWGSIVFHETKQYVFLGIGSLLLVVGMLLIANANLWIQLNIYPLRYLRRRFFPSTNANSFDIDALEENPSPPLDALSTTPSNEDDVDEDDDAIFDDNAHYSSPKAPSRSKSLLSRIVRSGIGLLFCIIAGCLNGTMMVPTKWAGVGDFSLSYIISFGIGALIVTLFIAILYFGVYFLRKRAVPSFKPSVALLPGILVGLLWNLGNFCATISTKHLGLIGFSLTQCAMVVSGLWGFFYLGELRNLLSITQFMMGLILLIPGCYMVILSSS